MARLLLLRAPRADARRRLQMARAQEIIEAKKLAKAEAAKVRRRREPQGLLQLRVRACCGELLTCRRGCASRCGRGCTASTQGEGAAAPGAGSEDARGARGVAAKAAPG